MSSQINYTYKHCNSQDLSKDLRFSEDIFSQILQDCFETGQDVTSINVMFEKNPSQATEHFTCSININAAGKNHYIKESGEHYSEIATQACHKAVKVVRSDKHDIDREKLNLE